MYIRVSLCGMLMLIWVDTLRRVDNVGFIAGAAHMVLAHCWKSNDACHSDGGQTSEIMFGEVRFKLTTPWIDSPWSYRLMHKSVQFITTDKKYVY